jgi:hypothetical protein
MVLLSLSTKLNQWLGPFLLRQGIKARYAAAGGILRDNLLADTFCLLPVAQKLIQVEAHDEAKAQVLKQASTQQPNVDDEAVTRIRVLESYLRPALVKNERWSDVRRWQFHSRLVKWARTEFLLAKYGGVIRNALHSFPTIRKSPQLAGSSLLQPGGAAASLLAGKLPFDLFEDDHVDEREGGTAKLPLSSLLTKAFGMNDWKLTKDEKAAQKEVARIAAKLGGTVIEIRGGSISIAHIPDDADVSKLSLEEILEVVGGHVMQCGPFNALCEDAGVYQFWTRDYVEQVGRYLLQRAATTHRETVILDVGAGDGLLVQLLRDFFENERERSTVTEPPSLNRSSRGRKSVRSPQRKAPSSNIPTIVASDNGTWGVSQKANVEQLSVQEAIDEYTANNGDNKQVIVLCSWMPMHEDWSAIFRSGDVDEYILIGECDDGQCGDNWETWGNPWHLVDDFDHEFALTESSAAIDPSRTGTEEMAHVKDVTPPYVIDGYKRRDLDELSPYQFSRFDCRSSKSGKTVSFRRRRG